MLDGRRAQIAFALIPAPLQSTPLETGCRAHPRIAYGKARREPGKAYNQER
jgi:hypothetical protein